ncbi:MAG: hypothetical protein CM1200mP28_14720 [Deltaproteobacteria bacterium]|nr:MAG: hypothetical protein CM1200mP28_14720 [Deltaproteobacteria bacterium]
MPPKYSLATKVVGPTVESRAMGSYIRDGINHLSRKNIESALEGSLHRLKTETLIFIKSPGRTGLSISLVSRI